MASAVVLGLFREAMDASRARDRSKARGLMHRVTQLDPHNETAWQWLAGVAETPLEAVTAFERVLALNPNNEKAKAGIRPARLQAGINAAKEKDIPTARRLLRAVVADDSKSELGWLWLASVCESPTEAMAHLKRVLAINPASKSALKGVQYYEAKLAKGAAVGDSGSYRAGGTPTDTAPALPPEPAPPPRDGPPRALVVDASRTNRKVVGLTLAGYETLEAEDAAEAVDLVRDCGRAGRGAFGRADERRGPLRVLQADAPAPGHAAGAGDPADARGRPGRQAPGQGGRGDRDAGQADPPRNPGRDGGGRLPGRAGRPRLAARVPAMSTTTPDLLPAAATPPPAATPAPGHGAPVATAPDRTASRGSSRAGNNWWACASGPTPTPSSTSARRLRN